MKDLVKVCALCERTIPYHQVVCKEHMPELEMYHKDTWFIELVAAQQRQYEIDLAELKLSTFGIQKEHKLVKSYTKLTYNDKLRIQQLYRNGLGYRRIAKTLQLPLGIVNMYIHRNKKRLTNNSSK
jgi:DNA-directed RNA polymerase specialized sigma24 family protein